MNFTVCSSYNADLDDSKSSLNPVFFYKAYYRFSLKRFGERTDSVLREHEPEELELPPFEFVEAACSLSGASILLNSTFCSQRKQ